MVRERARGVFERAVRIEDLGARDRRARMGAQVPHQRPDGARTHLAIRVHDQHELAVRLEQPAIHATRVALVVRVDVNADGRKSVGHPLGDAVARVVVDDHDLGARTHELGGERREAMEQRSRGLEVDQNNGEIHAGRAAFRGGRRRVSQTAKSLASARGREEMRARAYVALAIAVAIVAGCGPHRGATGVPIDSRPTPPQPGLNDTHRHGQDLDAPDTERLDRPRAPPRRRRHDRRPRGAQPMRRAQAPGRAGELRRRDDPLAHGRARRAARGRRPARRVARAPGRVAGAIDRSARSVPGSAGAKRGGASP